MTRVDAICKKFMTFRSKLDEYDATLAWRGPSRLAPLVSSALVASQGTAPDRAPLRAPQPPAHRPPHVSANNFILTRESPRRQGPPHPVPPRAPRPPLSRFHLKPYSRLSSYILRATYNGGVTVSSRQRSAGGARAVHPRLDHALALIDRCRRLGWGDGRCRHKRRAGCITHLDER